MSGGNRSVWRIQLWLGGVELRGVDPPVAGLSGRRRKPANPTPPSHAAEDSAA